MKPLLSGTQDSDKLQDLGQASVQIVHDLKNQLNGLKLYATFLRKRLEKSDRPEDELETVRKLISGIERAANDLSTIVQYARPVELKKQSRVDIQKLMRNVCDSINERSHTSGSLLGSISVESGETALYGEFDPLAIFDAFKSVSFGALKLIRNQTNPQSVVVKITGEKGSTSTVVIEWYGVNNVDHDPFRSFAGTEEIRMSLAAKLIEAHGGSASYENGLLRVRLPLSDSN